jgi:hypothetical protein
MALCDRRSLEKHQWESKARQSKCLALPSSSHWLTSSHKYWGHEVSSHTGSLMMGIEIVLRMLVSFENLT